MGQQVIILVLGFIVVVGIVITNTNDSVIGATESSVAYFTHTQSRNLSYSAAQLLFTRLSSNPSFRELNGLTEDLLTGTVSYTVKDAIFNGDTVIVVTARGIFNGDTTVTTVHLEKITTDVPTPTIPRTIKGVMTARSEVKTKGNMIIDGRDYDLEGELISGGGGLYGVWTTDDLDQSGNSKIGGYNGTSSYAPSRPANSNSYKQNMNGDETPITAEEVFGGAANGFSPGILKTLAKSGVGGSQYVTNTRDLNYPLRGITFVDLDKRDRNGDGRHDDDDHRCSRQHGRHDFDDGDNDHDGDHDDDDHDNNHDGRHDGNDRNNGHGGDDDDHGNGNNGNGHGNGNDGNNGHGNDDDDDHDGRGRHGRDHEDGEEDEEDEDGGESAEWQSANLQGEGILIVANGTRGAKIKNINSGTFKGIVIADRIDKIHNTIYGAVITLSNRGEMVGNGNGRLYFSSTAVKNAVNFLNIKVVAAGGNVGGTQANKNYGFGNSRIFIRNWYE